MDPASRVKRGASCLLRGLGGVLVFLATVSTVGSLAALLARARHGRGIMFADAEFLALVAVACAVPGVLALVAGTRLGKR